MPKEDSKSKERKQSKKKPYTRVTIKSFERFDDFTSENKTDITTADRSAADYAIYLCPNESLEKLILRHAQKLGKKLRILDAGCGKCVAVNELLSNEKLNDVIDSVTGVSIHYFEEIKAVLEKHKNRFRFFLGTVQDVLSQSKEQFDLIFDVFGAYRYSRNKTTLLQEFHHALTPWGEADVFLGPEEDLAITDTAGKKTDFFKWAEEKYPETFSVKSKYVEEYKLTFCKLTLTKATERYPLTGGSVQSYIEYNSKMASRQSIPHAFYQTLKQGNAIAISEVIDEPQQTNLRLLPFEKKSA